MAADPVPEAKAEGKKKKSRKSQLRVVFDTNALYVAPPSLGSASDLVRDDIVNLISESKYPDLDISWYLPEVVRHERQYQMQTEALKLRFPINKIERLLGHNLGLTDQVLLDHVKQKIDEKELQLGVNEIRLDHSKIDWRSMIHAASYRMPPFQAGEKEKGFRDALVAESFLQLLSDSPRSPNVCRVVLVTGDQLLSQSINERIVSSPNATVLSTVEELKGLINTLVSDVSEDFISQLKPKAAKLFFVSMDDKSTLLYRTKVQEQIGEKFKVQLEQKPEGTTFRKNGTWHLNPPNFSRKDGRRVFWTSRIEIEMEAGTVTRKQDLGPAIPSSGVILDSPFQANFPLEHSGSLLTHLDDWPTFTVPLKAVTDWNINNILVSNPSTRVVTHRGRDIYEVLWSAEVTMSKELKRSVIDELKHVELKCEPIVPGG
jgi:hypothetical protein